MTDRAQRIDTARRAFGNPPTTEQVYRQRYQSSVKVASDVCVAMQDYIKKMQSEYEDLKPDNTVGYNRACRHMLAYIQGMVNELHQ